MNTTKYTIASTSLFKKDYKLAMKRGQNVELLDEIIKTLASGLPLPSKHRDHPLSGNWAGHRECHISSDWLLVYRIDHNILVLTTVRTGTHADIFGL